MWHSSDISMESLLDTCEFPAVSSLRAQGRPYLSEGRQAQTGRPVDLVQRLPFL